MAYFVFPFSPETLPIALDKWSPYNFLTSLTWNASKYKSSSLNKAIASYNSNPKRKAFKKSLALVIAVISSVSSDVLISTAFLFKFILIYSFIFSTIVVAIFSQLSFNGVNLLGGTGILRIDEFLT